METSSLLKDLNYNPDKPAIQVLLQSNFTKEIRIAFEAGQVMKEHKTKFPIVVEIVEGAIDFGVQGTVHHLQKGDLISLEGNVPHDLQAIEKSIVRLTLSILDQTDRVKEVVSS
ncbi:cupin domain-containing protein [bacterium SCSIO 12741]|nr:cupin domain-containing protein [bacterium SCSIO 12741]